MFCILSLLAIVVIIIILFLVALIALAVIDAAVLFFVNSPSPVVIAVVIIMAVVVIIIIALVAADSFALLQLLSSLSLSSSLQTFLFFITKQLYCSCLYCDLPPWHHCGHCCCFIVVVLAATSTYAAVILDGFWKICLFLPISMQWKALPVYLLISKKHYSKIPHIISLH